MSVRFKQISTEPWDINTAYEVGTVVEFNDNKFVSLQNVPLGINLGMKEYWKILDAEEDISDIKEDIADIEEDISDIKEDIVDVKGDINDIHDTLDYYAENELGVGVTLSEETDFVVPNDGYIVVKSGNTAGDWYRVDIYGNSTVSNKRVAFKINSTTDGSSKYNLIPVYVRTGMVIRFSEKSTGNTTGSATYVPIVDDSE